MASSNQPKYQELAELYREQITSGQLNAGDRLPSFSELRAQHGLYPVTVEKFYALLEQEGLVVREQGRGTFVSDNRCRRGEAIGFLSTRFGSHRWQPYWTHLLDGIQRELSEAGLHLTLLEGTVEKIKWETIGGVIVTEMREESLTASLRRLPPGIACVSLLNIAAGCTSISSDDGAGIKQAVKYLVEQGHRRIGYLARHGQEIVEKRLTSYRAALRLAAIEPQTLWVREMELQRGQHYVDGGREAMTAWLHDGWAKTGCTALLVQNDEAAIGAMEALNAVGLRVPADVSVVGFDGIDVASYLRPRLATVEVPLQEIGRRGATILLRQMDEGQQREETIALPTRFRSGGTIAPPAHN